jgi:hypothetical protein
MCAPMTAPTMTPSQARFQCEKIAALGIEGLFEAGYIDALGDPSAVRGKSDIFERILATHELSAREVVVVQ